MFSLMWFLSLYFDPATDGTFCTFFVFFFSFFLLFFILFLPFFCAFLRKQFCWRISYGIGTVWSAQSTCAIVRSLLETLKTQKSFKQKQKYVALCEIEICHSIGKKFALYIFMENVTHCNTHTVAYTWPYEMKGGAARWRALGAWISMPCYVF